MYSKIIPAGLLAVVFGVVLGCLPFINEHLHWNLWYVLPISGLIFGLAAGWIQFGYLFNVNQRLTNTAMIVLVIFAVLGYASVEYGIYRTVKIPVEGHKSIPDGEYNISRLMTFGQFMKWSYAETPWSVISYIVDLTGAALGAAAVLLLCRDKYPFCILCTVYKERRRKYTMCLKFDTDKLDEAVRGIEEIVSRSKPEELAEYCEKINGNYAGANVDAMIRIDQRYCAICNESTFLGKISRRKGKEWNDIDDLKFVFTCRPDKNALE